MCAQATRFSVVIPARNGQQFLRDTIASVIAQTRPFDEILVIDDASVDGTRHIATAPEVQGRVAYRYNPVATGFVDAWNRAVQYASGEFVTILHQDDLLDPRYVEIVDSAIKLYPHAGHIYCGCNYIDGAGAIIRSTETPSREPVLYTGKQYAHNYLTGVLLNRHIHRCPGVTTRRELLLHRCTYRKEAGHIADDDFFLRVGAFTDVVGIAAPLASYREHPNSETGRLDLLSYRLAQDYLFQSRYYLDCETLLNGEDIACIHRQTVRFINLLLVQGLVMNNRDWIAKALALREDIAVLLPRWMERTLPLWARLMWKLSENPDAGLRSARLYARTIATVVRLRDRSRRLRALT